MIGIEPRGEILRLRQMYRDMEGLLVLSDTEFFATVDSISRWSIAHQLHHIALSSGAIFRGIDGLFGLPHEKGPKLRLVGFFVLLTGWIPRGRGRAPESVIPADRPRREEIAAALASSERLLERIEERADGLRELPGRKPHFAFGRLSALEWLRLARIHTRHHLRIIGDIRRGARGLQR